MLVLKMLISNDLINQFEDIINSEDIWYEITKEISNDSKEFYDKWVTMSLVSIHIRDYKCIKYFYKEIDTYAKTIKKDAVLQYFTTLKLKVKRESIFSAEILLVKLSIGY